MNIRDAFTEFILAQQADGRSQTTTKWYKDMLANGPYNPLDWLCVHNGGELETISTSLLRRYIVWMREQPNANTGKPRSEYTINAILRCLHKFFNWCTREYGISNPMKDRIKYPKNPPPEPKAVMLETAINMILSCGDNAIGKRNRAMLMFMLATGARRKEIAFLTVDRLNLPERRAVVIGKRNIPRVVAFDELTAQAINDWMLIRETQPALFYNMRSKKSLTSEGVGTIIDSIALKAGITERHNPHGWRHLFAQLYHRAGGTIAGLSKLLGHKSIKVTTDTYLVQEVSPILNDYDQRNPMRAAHDLLKKQEPPEK